MSEAHPAVLRGKVPKYSKSFNCVAVSAEKRGSAYEKVMASWPSLGGPIPAMLNIHRSDRRRFVQVTLGRINGFRVRRNPDSFPAPKNSDHFQK